MPPDIEPFCGDGTLDPSEECDDGGTLTGDGCNSTCDIEDGWTCQGAFTSVCSELCGNQTIDDGEDCDGDELGRVTCQTLGAGSGNLACTSECLFDVSGCVRSSKCGNGMLDLGEVCDAPNLNGMDCKTMGARSGALGCSMECMYDDSRCIYAECGDGLIDFDLGEECDDEDTDAGDGCSADCKIEPGWSCFGLGPSTLTAVCDNGTLEDGEVCDRRNFGTNTCQTEGFAGGDLSCSMCTSLDTSGCISCTPVGCQSAGTSRTFDTCSEFVASTIGRGQAMGTTTISGNTTGASDDDDTFSTMIGGGCLGIGPDNFHQIYLEAGDTLTASTTTTTSDYDISLAVYEGRSCSAKIICSDDGLGGDPETLTYSATQDGWVTIAVDGALSGDVGDYALTVSVSCTTESCCCF